MHKSAALEVSRAQRFELRDRRISYQGKGDEPAELHDHARFQIISTGPAPVSDLQIRTGVEMFLAGLRELGYTPSTLTSRPDHVVFDYFVETRRVH